MANYSVKLTVHGTVQGVSFRSFAKRNAEQLGLAGYVKNLSDGNVEVVAEGNKDKIGMLLESIRSGPTNSQVDRVDIEWSAFKGVFKDFKIIY